MKILVAPQAFKGSLDALGVADAIADGLRSIWPGHDYDILPVADGGEGTVEALVTATNGRYMQTRAEDPLGRAIDARWGILGDGITAVIEMAAASGLPLLRRNERNPMVTSTFGTGQLIRAALDAGAGRIIVGIGGSATNDAGAGMAHALGVRFLDNQGHYLPPGGRALQKLAQIDVAGLDPRLQHVDIIVASDVTNPLCGTHGASRVYGPQKGASPRDVEVLDHSLLRFAEIIEHQLGQNVRGIPGSGAAGGLGAGLMAFTDAKMHRGVEIIFEAMQFERHLESASMVFTGEGRIDAQDAFGKAPIVVAQRAAARGIPVVVIAGSIGSGYQDVFQEGVSAIVSIVNRPMNIERAVAQTAQLVSEASAQTARLIGIGQELATHTSET